MNKTGFFLATTLLFLGSYHLSAQKDRLSDYNRFFIHQSAEYQNWMNKMRLGEVLRVRETEVRGDSLVVLFLAFNTNDTEQILALWDQLQADYNKLKEGGSLEKALFNQMLWNFDVKPAQAEIRIFDTYDLSKTACFKARIYFSKGVVKTSLTKCRNEIAHVKVKSTDLQASKKLSVQAFQKKYTKSVVFGKLTPYLKTRYETPKCENRHPKFELYSSSEEISFEVTDLCKEVLVDESNPWWCTVLEPLCSSCKNCIKRERLKGQIFYEPTLEGFQLKIDISASYGSGFYDKPRDNGYHDLQLDYPQYLKKYADRLSAEIFNFLTKP